MLAGHRGQRVGLCPEVGLLLPSQDAFNAAIGFEKGKMVTMRRNGVAGH